MTEVSINKQARLSEHLTSSSVAALSHSSELDGLRLTPHFTLGELCKTIEKSNKSLWLHFAVRQNNNRRKINLMNV